MLSLLPKPQPDPAHVLHRENILVLDIFFEALNYETIEQKKAYEVAGLLGECWWLCWGPHGSTWLASPTNWSHVVPVHRVPDPESRASQGLVTAVTSSARSLLPLPPDARPDPHFPLLCRRHWGADGAVHRGQYPHSTGAV